MASDTAYSPSPPPHTTAATAATATATMTTGEVNHRKRRRNRTRVSCLNCYASKRKCDRKRPCTRCTKHGLTGLCFYELDDPAASASAGEDETTRLRRRIAELEAVVREMNNRPHPRWHRLDRELDAFFAAEASPVSSDVKVSVKLEQTQFTPSPFGSPLTELDDDDDDNDDDNDAHIDEHTHNLNNNSPTTHTPPPTHTSTCTQTSPSPPPSSPSPSPSPSLYSCPCLATATLHSPLLYLASALRASRDALQVSHSPSSPCLLLHRITQLDQHIFSAPAPSMYTVPTLAPAPALAPVPVPTPAPPSPTLTSLYTCDHDPFAYLDYDWP